MKKSLATAAVLLGLSPAIALAHHGWGSYDVARKFIIESPIESVVWQNPHVHVMTTLRPLTETGFGAKKIAVLGEYAQPLRTKSGKIQYRLC